MPLYCYAAALLCHSIAIRMNNIPYQPELPKGDHPIILIGAGSIVRDAHLPAYRQAGFSVHGIWNRTREAADELAKNFGIQHVFSSFEDALQQAPDGTIWDVALPADLFADYLERLPDGAPVLIQKPMGENIEEARRILNICRRKRLRAAINFQLRFAPFVMAAKHLVDTGAIGELLDMETRVTIHTPWDHFPFLQNVSRLEIAYHSVHHIDCIRHFLGDPLGVYAKTLCHPDYPKLRESRSSIILDYGERARANIQTNHFHKFGAKHQESYIKWEGSKGAIKATMGLLMNYPDGVPDRFEYCLLDAGGSHGEWQEVPLEGSWFPEAFVGSMAQVMRHVEGTLEDMPTSVEDAIRTMACVEAAYASSSRGGVPIDQYLEEEAL